MRVTTPLAPRLDELSLCAWVAHAEPGEALAYHQGSLAIDRDPPGQPFLSAEARALAKTGDMAMKLAERGFVHLVQRRIAPDQFLYLAIARPRAGEGNLSISSLLSKGTD
jgi:hypothetical protein